jgi:hypothetical protein
MTVIRFLQDGVPAGQNALRPPGGDSLGIADLGHLEDCSAGKVGIGFAANMSKASRQSLSPAISKQ